MNKTININLSGIIFHIDEEAYKKLSKYLDAIKASLASSEGRDEIVADIEARIAELFQSKMSDSKQVIGMNDVDEVIAVMGQPEDYRGDEYSEDHSSSYTGSYTTSYTSKKRVFRNSDDKVIGGVCGGIAAYFDIDTIWIRLFFVVAIFGFGFGFPLYIILWIIIPEAKTTAEKLQMRGEKVNISNIERTIKEEMETLKKKLNDLGKSTRDTDFSKPAERAKSGFEKLLAFFINLFTLMVKFALRLIGIAMILAGIFFTFGLLGAFLGFGDFAFSMADDFSGVSITDFFQVLFMSDTQMNLAILTVTVFLLIPLVQFVYLGLRMLFKLEPVHKSIRTAMASVWIATGIVLAVIFFQLVRDSKQKASYIQNIELKEASGQRLYLDVNPDAMNQLFEESDFMIQEEGGDTLMRINTVKMDIRKSLSDNFELEVTKIAHGSNRKAARKRAKQISYTYQLQDSVLFFNNHHATPTSQKIRMQRVRVTLYVPVGRSVYLEESMIDIIYDIKNTSNTWDFNMVEHEWVMTERGLTCVDCRQRKNRKQEEEDYDDYEDEDEDEEEDEEGGKVVHAQSGGGPFFISPITTIAFESFLFRFLKYSF